MLAAATCANLINAGGIVFGITHIKKNSVRKVGSSARTRTWNLVVTSAPKFLLGLDYLFTRSGDPDMGCRALPPSLTQGTSFRSSLCTFPVPPGQGLAQGYRFPIFAEGRLP
jgi:hypothetical protein